MTNKTRAELIAVARSAALAQPESNPADCAVDALLDEIGYEPAPEPPTYKVGTRADVITVAGVKYAGCAWDGVAWCSSYTRFRNDTIESVEVIPTYDPSRELVIPLDKVPPPLAARDASRRLDRREFPITSDFLRLVADLAQQARGGAA